MSKTNSCSTTLQLSLLVPVLAAVILYRLDSFDPAPLRTREFSSQPIFVPLQNPRLLEGAEWVGVGELWGPEDLAYDPKLGVIYIYTGCDDGWIKRVTVNESTADSVVESWVNTGGRPLGLVLGHDDDVIVQPIIPSFNGNCHPENLIYWFRKVDKFLEYMEISEENEVRYVARKLQGYASRWWKQLQYNRERQYKQPVMTWLRMRQLGQLRVTGDGKIEVLTNEAEGVEFRLTKGVDITVEGMIYFTDASSKHNLEEGIQGLMEGRPYGRFHELMIPQLSRLKCSSEISTILMQLRSHQLNSL
ncbi:hypothetical protein RHSIM_Rhsim08G0028500 [Rhododendron simsii]|uniref:Uncharacterized protein n=1 Tax=Rhododendron simsii TaxID=118357 RepID=A0A834GJS2_RHOSS|nr:hypothetical protein RHSIM_Rhsim08G0028500 [Rhododendron simsii]